MRYAAAGENGCVHTFQKKSARAPLDQVLHYAGPETVRTHHSRPAISSVDPDPTYL